MNPPEKDNMLCDMYYDIITLYLQVDEYMYHMVMSNM